MQHSFGTFTTSKMFARVAYVIIILILLTTAVASDDSLSNISKAQIGYYEKLEQNLGMCVPNCLRNSLVCVCPNDQARVRRDMAEDSMLSHQRGFFNPLSTFSITPDANAISLEWVSTSTTSNEVFVSGKAVADIELKPHTGVIWHISNREASETRTVGVGVYGYYQEYTYRFERWIMDRTVGSRTVVRCTGECPKNCGCDALRRCTHKLYPNDRNWGCNPFLCASDHNGCTCCVLEATVKESNIIIGLWSPKYVATKIAFCLQTDIPKYTCRMVTDGTNMAVDKYTVMISRAHDVDERLPKIIGTVHRIKNHKIDTQTPDHIILDPDVCDPHTCNHGEPGDFSFTNLVRVLNGDDTSVNMVWTGTTQERVCHFAREPDCITEGVVMKNSDLFENLIDRAERVETNFHVLESKLEFGLTTPSLTLLVRPKGHAGSVNVMVSAKNVILRRKVVELSVGLISIKTCGGCRGCSNGFNCMVAIKLDQPDKFMIKFTSTSSLIGVEAQSFEASRNLQLFNVTLFSPTKISTLELCVVEQMSKCSSLAGIELKEPTPMLVHTHEQIMSTGSTNDSISFLDKIEAFFSSVGEGIYGLFTHWWGIPFIVLALLAVYIFFSGCSKSCSFIMPFKRYKNRQSYKPKSADDKV